MNKYFILLLLLLNSLYAVVPVKKCSIEKEIIYSILLNEGLKKKAGYEYIISFNNSYEADKIRKTELKNMFINNRTIDCKNRQLCSYILYELTKINIINLDLGAFQINYKFHNLDTLADYFDIHKSYIFACKYIENCVKQYGDNFKAYACYHSRTKEHNEKYQKNLKANYIKVKHILSGKE